MRTKRPDRSTHQHDGDLVIFLIGMTVNKAWRPDLWVPSFTAMPRMLRELSREKNSGLLGFRVFFEGLNPVVVQYWDSLDKLYDYAGDSEAEHRPAWRAFNRRASKDPRAVGVWHETFTVSRAESVYVGTPPLGLAKFTSRIPVGREQDRALSRMRAAPGPVRDPEEPVRDPEEPAPVGAKR